MSEINGIAIISFQEISSINSTSSISNLQRSQLTKELHQYRQNPNIIDKLAREGPYKLIGLFMMRKVR